MRRPDKPACGLCEGAGVISRSTRIPQATRRIGRGLWMLTESCDACGGTGERKEEKTNVD